MKKLNFVETLIIQSLLSFKLASHIRIILSLNDEFNFPHKPDFIYRFSYSYF